MSFFDVEFSPQYAPEIECGNEIIVKLDGDVKKLERENTRLLSDVATNVQKSKNLTIQVGVLEDKNHALQDEIAALEKKCDGLEHTLRDSMTYTELVKKMLDKANDASSESSESVDHKEIASNLVEDNKRLEAIIESMSREWSADQKKFDDVNKAVSEENQKLREEVNRLRAVAEEDFKSTSMSDTLKTNDNEHQATIRKLTEEVEDLTYQLSQNTEEYICQREVLANVSAKVEAYRHDAGEVIFLNNQFKEENRILTNEVSRLEQELKNAQKQQQTECAARKEMRVTTAAALAVTRSELMALKESSNYQLHIKQAELEFYRKEAESIKLDNGKLIEGVKLCLASTEETTIQLRNRVAYLEAQLTAKEVSCRVHGHAYQEMVIRLNNSKAEYDASVAEKKHMLGKSIELAKEVERLQDVLLSKTDEAAVIQSNHFKRVKKYQDRLQIVARERDLAVEEKKLIDTKLHTMEEEMDVFKQWIQLECEGRFEREKQRYKLDCEKQEHLDRIYKLEEKIKNMEVEQEAEMEHMEKKHQKVVEDLGVEELDDVEEEVEEEDEANDEDDQQPEWELVQDDKLEGQW